MKNERYPYYADTSFFDFEFDSIGPKGKIRKIATFIRIKPNLYSFGFGDWDQATSDINDTAISNNGDGTKVLSTVAAIIHDFTMVFRDAVIYIEGSTPARTRWYQMNINGYWNEINELFRIQGHRGGKWEPFQKGVNYSAFMGQRR